MSASMILHQLEAAERSASHLLQIFKQQQPEQIPSCYAEQQALTAKVLQSLSGLELSDSLKDRLQALITQRELIETLLEQYLNILQEELTGVQQHAKILRHYGAV